MRASRGIEGVCSFDFSGLLAGEASNPFEDMVVFRFTVSQAEIADALQLPHHKMIHHFSILRDKGHFRGTDERLCHVLREGHHPHTLGIIRVEF